MVENLLVSAALEKKVGVVDNTQRLEELHQYAYIPQTCGVVGKVIDVLNRRVGVSSLDIENVARELNLSKRTLQRHLREHGSSFIELRDKVRFRQAMICLLEKQLSIETTANYLNFSDRTSFTNAFKHWSGFSPSTFRKRYNGCT